VVIIIKMILVCTLMPSPFINKRHIESFFHMSLVLQVVYIVLHFNTIHFTELSTKTVEIVNTVYILIYLGRFVDLSSFLNGHTGYRKLILNSLPKVCKKTVAFLGFGKGRGANSKN